MLTDDDDMQDSTRLLDTYTLANEDIDKDKNMTRTRARTWAGQEQDKCKYKKRWKTIRTKQEEDKIQNKKRSSKIDLLTVLLLCSMYALN